MGMANPARRTVEVTRTVATQVHAKNLPFLAGSLAYHAFLMLLPLLFVAPVVISAAGYEFVSLYVATVSEAYLTTGTNEYLTTEVQSPSSGSGILLLAALAFLWSVVRVFRGLDLAFAEIYGQADPEPLREQFLNGVVAAFATALALIGGIVVVALISLVAEKPFSGVLSPLIAIPVLAAAFFSLYYVFPNVDLTAAEVLPGTAVAVGGWTVFHAVFQMYATETTAHQAYGTLGITLMLLVWLYASLLILLVGGVVNAVLAGRARSIDAVEGDPTERV